MSRIRKVPLGELATLQAGVGFPLDLQGRTKGTYPLAKVGDISRWGRSGQSVLSSADHYVDEIDLVRLRAKPVPKGSILFAKIGEAMSHNHRVIAGCDMLIDNNAMAAIPGPDVASEYLYYYLRTVDFYRLASATTVPALRKSVLEKILIPLPSLTEQRHIVTLLSVAETLRAQRRVALAQIDALTQSVFIDLFDDPVRHSKEKLWTVRECITKGIILEIQDGNHGERHPKVEDFVEDGVPFIAANCLNDGGLNLTTCDFLPPRWLKELRIGFAKANDVLLSHKGTIGLTAIVPERKEPVILSPQVTYYRTDAGKLDPVFLRGYFQTDYFQSRMNKNAQQTTRAYLGITRQLDLPVSVPPFGLQTEFARRVAAIEKLKNSHRSSLAELDVLFDALQHRAFRGDF